LDFAVAIALLLALASVPPLHAAEWPNVRESDTLWPLAPLGGPQWPTVPAEAIKAPQTAQANTNQASSGAPKDETAYRVDTLPEVAAPAAPPKGTSDDALVTGASLALP